MQIQNMLRQAKDFVRSQDGIIAPLPLSEEELNPDTQEDLSLQVYPLESTAACYDVPYKYPEEAACSEFSYFEDGRQRTLEIGHIPVHVGKRSMLLPVHYCVASAVILKRRERQLQLWSSALIKSGICVERSLVPNQRLLDEFESAGLTIIDTQAQGGDYYTLRKRALHKAKMLRLALEDQIIETWRMSHDAVVNFLVVDGTLMNFRSVENVSRCIGVSKSFGSRYFSTSDHARVMGMRECQRSATFRFHAPGHNMSLGGKDRVSWYLRLRTRPGSDPEFGLIRVEMSLKYASKAAEYADRLSRSLLSERLPTAYPAARWDKHLYPITVCENYLSSITPSTQTIVASMKGTRPISW